MARTFRQTAFSLSMPGGFVFLAALGFLRPQGLPSSLETPLLVWPVVVLSFGLIFGWYLHSVKLVLSLLLFALADRGLAMTGGAPSSSSEYAMFSITAVLLPLNLLALSVSGNDDSVLRGILRILFVLLQPFLVLWLCYPEQREWAEAFAVQYVPWSSSAWTPVPQAALMTFAVAMTLHVLRFYASRDPMDSGAVWALASLFIAYHCMQYGWRPTNFFAAAGLMLVLSLVQLTHQRTYQDDLTGVAGRLAYEEAVARLGKRYTVAVLGIDQLKSYTGVYGRPVAEQILRLIARKVQYTCQGGKVHRVSGEELTILFPYRVATDTIVALESVRKAVESTTLTLRGKDRVLEMARESVSGGRPRLLPVTVSIGVAESPSDDSGFSSALKCAFRALYEAKGAGGNVVKRGLVSLSADRRSYHEAGRIVATGGY